MPFSLQQNMEDDEQIWLAKDFTVEAAEQRGRKLSNEIKLELKEAIKAATKDTTCLKPLLEDMKTDYRKPDSQQEWLRFGHFGPRKCVFPAPDSLQLRLGCNVELRLGWWRGRNTSNMGFAPEASSSEENVRGSNPGLCSAINSKEAERRFIDQVGGNVWSAFGAKNMLKTDEEKEAKEATKAVYGTAAKVGLPEDGKEAAIELIEADQEGTNDFIPYGGLLYTRPVWENMGLASVFFNFMPAVRTALGVASSASYAWLTIDSFHLQAHRFLKARAENNVLTGYCLGGENVPQFSILKDDATREDVQKLFRRVRETQQIDGLNRDVVLFCSAPKTKRVAVQHQKPKDEVLVNTIGLLVEVLLN